MSEKPITKRSVDFYITPNGIVMNRKARICASDSITLNGKNIIFEDVILRGDLRSRSNATSIVLGHLTYFEKGVIIKPPFRLYKNEFFYMAVRLGDNVMIGEGSVIMASAIGSNVTIGKGCVIGRFAVIKNCVQVLDDTYVPPHMTLSPFVIYGGSPARQVGVLPDYYGNIAEKAAKNRYKQFKTNLETYLTQIQAQPQQ